MAAPAEAAARRRREVRMYQDVEITIIELDEDGDGTIDQEIILIEDANPE